MDVALSRRRFVQAGLAGLVAAPLIAQPRTLVDGLHIGLQTFSMRGIRYPDLVAAVQQTGIGECELFSAQLDPARVAAADLDYFKDVRAKFKQAGMTIFTYNPRFVTGGRGRRGGMGGARTSPPPPRPVPAPPLTDAQIEGIFAGAQALGAPTLSGQMPLATVQRIVPFAARHRMITAVESTDPDELIKAAALSPWLRMSVDIGNFTRLGLDALSFVKDQYEHLLSVHLKDCKIHGTSVPFGQGDAPIKEVVRFLAGKRGGVRAYIDCDYPGTGTSAAEVQRCFAYVHTCLA